MFLFKLTGTRSLITAVRLDQPDWKPLQISQGQYRDGSFLNHTLKKRGTRSQAYIKYGMERVQQIMTDAPSQKSILGFDDYVSALALVWDDSWIYHSRIKIRKNKFTAWQHRESWMQKMVNKVKDLASRPTPPPTDPIPPSSPTALPSSSSSSIASSSIASSSSSSSSPPLTLAKSLPGVVLFGNGANGGKFGRLRGGGVKGI